MGYKVVYFSRTGISKRIAGKIANKISCTSIEVTDNMNWKGILGFLKGGYYASMNKDVEIKVNGVLDNNDEIILITPLWAGGPAPAIRIFLKNIPSDKVHLVVTADGSDVKKSIIKYEKKNSNFKSVRGIIKNKNNEELVIEELVNEII